MEWVDYPMFEYEKALGAREVTSLQGSLSSGGEGSEDLLIARATFLRAVGGKAGGVLPTTQSKIEESHRELRKRRTKRQSTRFLVHGLHEYKGKFNPQMARSLINVVDPTATSLIDPFCGSGTSLIEGLRLGLHVGGVDKNPLAAWMAQVKLRTLRASGDVSLGLRFGQVVDQVTDRMRGALGRGAVVTPPHVTSDDDAYLRHWFPEPVLAGLWAALDVADEEPDDVCADVVRLTVSSIVRSVSWQLPEDLRVRRRPATWTPPDVVEVFSKAAGGNALALQEVGLASSIDRSLSSVVLHGSSQSDDVLRAVATEGRRLVLTSPPYATALPYIDTDRLSLVLLGLAQAHEIKVLERELTGSREWTAKVHREWDSARSVNRDDLPAEVLTLIRRIAAFNARDDAGFRRAAVPSLLYRYFSDMGRTLTAMGTVLRPGERAIMVVGSNRTGRGESQVAISTPELVGAVAEDRGYVLNEIISLETWPRYGMHAANAVNEERAVVLTRKDEQLSA